MFDLRLHPARVPLRLAMFYCWSLGVVGLVGGLILLNWQDDLYLSYGSRTSAFISLLYLAPAVSLVMLGFFLYRQAKWAVIAVMVIAGAISLVGLAAVIRDIFHLPDGMIRLLLQAAWVSALLTVVMHSAEALRQWRGEEPPAPPADGVVELEDSGATMVNLAGMPLDAQSKLGG